MPRVPAIPEPSVSLAPIPGARVSVDQPSEAFQSGLASPRVAKAAMGIGEELQKAAIEERNKAVDTAFLDWDNKYASEQMSAQNDLERVKGVGALDASTKTKERFDKFHQDASKEIANADVREKVERAYRLRRQDLARASDSYANDQYQKHQGIVDLEAYKKADEGIAQNPTPVQNLDGTFSPNPSVVLNIERKKAILMSEAMRSGHAKRVGDQIVPVSVNGIVDTWLENHTQEAVSESHAAVIRDLLTREGGSFYRANAYYRGVLDEEAKRGRAAFTSKDRNEIDRALHTGRVKDNSANYADMFSSGKGPAGAASGLVEPGTIKDLASRPVVQNADGSVSTERSFSIGENGKEVLIPQVVDGKLLTQEEAIAHYKKTGEHLGKFSSVEAANAYAVKLHNDQAARVQPAQKAYFSSEHSITIPLDTDPSNPKSEPYPTTIPLIVPGVSAELVAKIRAGTLTATEHREVVGIATDYARKRMSEGKTPLPNPGEETQFPAGVTPADVGVSAPAPKEDPPQPSRGQAYDAAKAFFAQHPEIDQDTKDATFSRIDQEYARRKQAEVEIQHEAYDAVAKQLDAGMAYENTDPVMRSKVSPDMERALQARHGSIDPNSTGAREAWTSFRFTPVEELRKMSRQQLEVEFTSKMDRAHADAALEHYAAIRDAKSSKSAIKVKSFNSDGEAIRYAADQLGIVDMDVAEARMSRSQKQKIYELGQKIDAAMAPYYAKGEAVDDSVRETVISQVLKRELRTVLTPPSIVGEYGHAMTGGIYTPSQTESKYGALSHSEKLIAQPKEGDMPRGQWISEMIAFASSHGVSLDYSNPGDQAKMNSAWLASLNGDEMLKLRILGIDVNVQEAQR